MVKVAHFSLTHGVDTATRQGSKLRNNWREQNRGDAQKNVTNAKAKFTQLYCLLESPWSTSCSS